MDINFDVVVVVLYFVLILLLGSKIGRKHKNDSAQDFLTGGKQMGWFRTSMTMIATSINVGIIGVVGLGFVWGMSIQPNAANLWFAAPLAAVFFIPIYWRTKIVTTPELLEKRFNASCRTVFSLMMILFNIIFLGTSLYLGGYMLEYFFGWNLYLSCVMIGFIVWLLNFTGGMKAVLTIDFYQGIFITITFLIIGFITLYKIGGLSGFFQIHLLNKADKVLPSLLLPFDWSLSSTQWYAMPIGLVWAMIAGTSWTACNFSMVQRLLSAKSEKHAQKAVLFTAFGGVFATFIGYAIGVVVHSLNARVNIQPDQAFLFAILHYLPMGLRGLIIVGMLASLVSSVNGLLTSSTTLIIEDLFLRFFRRNALEKTIKPMARIMQIIILLLAAFLIPLSAKEINIVRLIQDLVSIPLGIIFSLFIMAVFSTRITPNAAFVGSLVGILFALVVFIFFPDVNFWNRGSISSLIVLLVAVFLSFFEKRQTLASLENLTVFTYKDSRSAFIGKIAWTSVIWWCLIIQISWLVFTIGWELLLN